MIRDVILTHANGLRVLPSGWSTCKCPLCGDYKVRGGFKFEGEGFGYNCFNCGAGIRYDPSEYSNFSDDAVSLLTALGVPELELRELEMHYKREYIINGRKPEKIARDSKPVIRSKLVTKALEMPPYLIPLKDADSVWADVARAYLTVSRGVDPNAYDYHILDYNAPSVPVKEIQRWHKRVIIPYRYNGELVFYQGRSYAPDVVPKYLNSYETGADALFSRVDLMYDPDVDTIFIVEGFFDALPIDGIACFRNKLTPDQIEVLKTLDKRVVYIPDRKGNGFIGANQMLEAGFELGLPDIGSCKDIDEAVQRYGKFYVLTSLYQNIYNGDEAAIRLNVYCIDGNKNVRK